MFNWHARFQRKFSKNCFLLQYVYRISRKHRIYIYIFLALLITDIFLSYSLPFGFLFSLKYFSPNFKPPIQLTFHVIQEQKQQQLIAYKWLKENILNSNSDLHKGVTDTIISQYSSDHLANHKTRGYRLLKDIGHDQFNKNEPIIISILYVPTDIDHREGKFYVGQVIYRLLKNDHDRFVLTLCENGNSDSEISDEVKILRDNLQIFLVNSSSGKPKNIFEHEKNAHLQCILANFESFPKAQFLVLLQDDAEPIDDNFYSKLESLIDNRLKRQWPLDGTRKFPGFVKIYHPRWLIGYSNPNGYVITQLISSSLLISLFIFMTCKICRKRFIENWSYQEIFNFMLFESRSRSSRWKFKLDILNFLLFSINLFQRSIPFLCIFLSTLISLFLLEHTNTNWLWRSIHPSFYALYPAPSCCLPGVIYFRQTYLKITNYLDRIECSKRLPIDTALDNLLNTENLNTYLVEPNLVRHIGLYSRLRKSYINPYLLDKIDHS